MDSKGERLKGGEITMWEKRNVNGNELIVTISTEGDAEAETEGESLKGSSSKALETAGPKQTGVDSPRQASTELSTGVAKSAPISCLSPEITSFSPTRNEPLEAPNVNEALVSTLDRWVKSNVQGNEVIATILTEGDAEAVTEGESLKGLSSKELETAAPKQNGVDLPHQASTESSTGVAKSALMSCPSPEITSFSPTRNEPPEAANANEALVSTFNRSVKRNVKGNEVIVTEAEPEGESLKGSSSKALETAAPKQTGVDSPRQASTESSTGVTKSGPMSCPSPKITSFSPTRNEPPEAPNANEALVSTLNRSVKRNVKGNEVIVNISNEGDAEAVTEGKSLKGSSANVRLPFRRCWTVFFLILGCLVASSTVYQFEASTLWGFEMWKWCVLLMVLFCGMSVINWVMHFIKFLIERNSLLQKEVLYCVLGCKKSIQVLTWLALVLLTWILLFNQGVKRSKIADKVLDYITWTLVSILIGSLLWFLKTLLLKILTWSFHATVLFDRIHESIFHQYILQTLSGPPLIEEAEWVAKEPSDGQFSFRTTRKGKTGKEKKMIDIRKTFKMKQEKVSAWTMYMLIDAVSNSGLSTLSNTLDESVDDGLAEQADKEITNEMEAMAAAYQIFINVAQPGCEYFVEDDLQRFMIKEEVDLVFPLLEGAETGRIDIKSLTNWVVKVYQGRKALIHALTSTAVRQLNKLVTGIAIVLTIVIWLLLMEIATTKLLLLLSSQLFMAAFIFGNTCKTIFEAIIFVFVMHPFDVGDCCAIDGVQLMVEDMSILNTVFLKLDNEKIYYPNLVLAMKPISNYNRSPDMGDEVEFSIDFMTPLERITAMKEKIKKYLEKNPQHWHPNHHVVVSEIENVNKMKMRLYVNHTMNFQDFAEKNRRRTELVFELKRIFNDLNIRYDLLPQEVQQSQSENKKQV